MLRPGCDASLIYPDRQQDQQQAGNNCLYQRGCQHQVTGIGQRCATALTQLQDFRQCPPFKEVKKIRLLIAGRAQVELVVIQKALRLLIAKQCLGGIMEPGVTQAIVAVALVTRDARVPGNVKGTRCAECAHASMSCATDGTVLDQQGAGLPAADQDELLSRVVDAAGTQGGRPLLQTASVCRGAAILSSV